MTGQKSPSLAPPQSPPSRRPSRRSLPMPLPLRLLALRSRQLSSAASDAAVSSSTRGRWAIIERLVACRRPKGDRRSALGARTWLQNPPVAAKKRTRTRARRTTKRPMGTKRPKPSMMIRFGGTWPARPKGLRPRARSAQLAVGRPPHGATAIFLRQPCLPLRRLSTSSPTLQASRRMELSSSHLSALNRSRVLLR